MLCKFFCFNHCYYSEYFHSIRIDLLFFSSFEMTRYEYGYFHLTILSEYVEYANSLCEFVLNTIVLDYVVRVSIRNRKNLMNNIHRSKSTCVSLDTINLDTDFLSYREKMRRIW